MADFGKAVAATLEREGGYSNDPHDSGGETCWGITVQEARNSGYTGPMLDFPIEMAKGIYREHYWNPIRGDQLPDQAIASEMFDTGVNIGVNQVVRFLQRVLNVLNKNETLWPDLYPDGQFGPKTLEALAIALSRRPEYRQAILNALRSLQGVRYIELCESNHNLEDFALGWLLRV